MEVKLVNLTKVFSKKEGDVVAVDHINITIPTGKKRNWSCIPKLCFISTFDCKAKHYVSIRKQENAKKRS